MRLNIKRRILGLAVSAAVLPLIVSFSLLAMKTPSVKQKVADSMSEISQNNASGIVRLVYRMCDITQKQSLAELNLVQAMVRGELQRGGAIKVGGDPIAWQAVNRETGVTTTVSLPAMLWGERPFLPKATTKLDLKKEQSRAFIGIYQRANDDGDMLCVADIGSGKGVRSEGDYITARTAKGESSPIISTVLQGEEYTESIADIEEFLVNAYMPLWDSSAQSEVIGMLHVSLDMSETIEGLRRTFMETSVGRSGYLALLVGKGDMQGKLILSREGKDDGKNAWDLRDADGNLVIQASIRKALGTEDGMITYDRYRMKEPDRAEPRAKVAVLTYFEPWNWVISAATYEEDNEAAIVHFSDAVAHFVESGTVGGGVVMALMAGLAFVLSGTIARSVRRIIAVAQMIAQGDLAEAEKTMIAIKKEMRFKFEEEGEEAVDLAEQDESRALFGAIARMTRNLSTLVGQVQRSSVQLASAATQITSASRQQEASISEFGSSTTEVTAAVKEISATVQELAKTMRDVQSTTANTVELTGGGRTALSGMESSMRKLKESGGIVSERLARINDKAGSINGLVTTISKLSDQTNLLSLNAAIEAEKAGEHGLGFSVVAREMRRLADQTAVALLDIEQTVRDMQNSVTSGVMEMDKFTGDVSNGVRAVVDISMQLDRVMEQVEGLKPLFDTVNEGMNAHSAGVQQISEAMVHLNSVARHSTESLVQFNAATDQLREAARCLQQEAARFKV